jgi:hypothetical protein
MNKITFVGVSMRILTGVLLLSYASISALSDQMVVPKQYETVEGPEGISTFIENARHVFVYSADLFSDMPAGGGFIEGVTFRYNQRISGPFTYDAMQEIEVHAGITSKPPDSFPQRTEFPIPFSILEGRSDQVVLPRASIHMKDTILPNVVNPFNIHIPFSTPYRYDPATAHFYVDMRTFNGLSLFVDAPTESLQGVVGLLGSLESYDVRRSGPIALFHFTPIPEPSVSAISIGFGFLLLLGRSWLVKP